MKTNIPIVTAATPLHFKYYDLILAFSACILLISNLAATKLVQLGPLIGDGGAVIFPLAYIFDDVLTEVYGFRYARRAIWVSFGVLLLGVAAFTIVRFVPAATGYTDQASYVKILGFFPQIVLASMSAYFVGSFTNTFVLAKVKIKMQGRKLWVRLVLSTAIGELFDTLVFAAIAFGLTLSWPDFWNYFLVGWGWKTLVEIVLLPLTYPVIGFLKRREGVDVYDIETHFVPLPEWLIRLLYRRFGWSRFALPY